MARIAIVDEPDSEHEQLMRRCARIGSRSPEIVLVPCDLLLADRLVALEGVCSVAFPITVRGGNAADRFCQRVAAAFAGLAGRGIRVFVADRRRPRSYLATVSGAIRTSSLGGRGALKLGHPRDGSSGATRPSRSPRRAVYQPLPPLSSRLEVTPGLRHLQDNRLRLPAERRAAVLLHQEPGRVVRRHPGGQGHPPDPVGKR